MEQKIRRDRNMGDNLRRLRIDKGISQEKLCAELQRRGCDIGRTTYAKYDTMSETFFEHEKSANAAVTIFKWADTFELHMEIQNLVKADIFLRFVLFDQGGHGCPDL